MKNKLLLTLALLCLAFFNVKAQNVLTTLPDADVYDINGAHTTLHQLAKNKILILDCWFIPCPQCFMAMDILHKTYAKYLNNKDVCFITICMTDSALTKKFIKQDSLMKPYIDQYQYFSNLKDFKLPVYFIDGCNSKVPLGTKNLTHFAPDDKSKCPDVLFKFTGYPTCMVFDKKGKLLFTHTGFDSADKYGQRLSKAIGDAFANNN